MDTLTLGDVDVTRVVELASKGLPRDLVFPDVELRRWREHEHWLAPEFLDLGEDVVRTMNQSWLLRSEGRTILIDAGIGNGKDRPYMPFFDKLDTNFLDNLAAAGAQPEDVDLVVCTHIHTDHVGWNTRSVNGEWVPTFPNADYIIPRADFDYWNPANGHRTRSGPRMMNVFEDSVAPVHRAGKAVIWEGDRYDVDANLSIEPAPGHTPGSALVRLRSGTEKAVFAGDALHSPLQIPEPDCCPSFDEDEPRARVTRRRVLEQAADENELVFPAHFPGPGAAEVARDGTTFTVKEWATWR